MIANNDELRTLFVGDLAIYCTENDLEHLFSQFGPIEKVTLKRGLSGSTNLSYGFVKFFHSHSAEAATSMKGFMFMGRAIRIGRAGSRGTDKPLKPKEGPSRRDTAQIHVSFISKQVDALINEETLRSLFSHYGQVIDVAIKKSKFDHKLRIQNGYGFIHFPLTSEGIQAAITATREVHQITVDRVVYDCTLSHLLESYLTPDQIAFAYASPTPAAFKGRPYERKREMYYRKELTSLSTSTSTGVGSEQDRAANLSFSGTGSFSEKSPSHSGLSYSPGVMSHLSSWESARFMNCLELSSTSPFEESRLFHFDSPLRDTCASMASTPEKIDLSKLLGLPESSSGVSDHFRQEAAAPRLPSVFPCLQDLPLNDRLNSSLFGSWVSH